MAAPQGRLVLRTFLQTADNRTAPVAAIEGSIQLGQWVYPSQSVGLFEHCFLFFGAYEQRPLGWQVQGER